MATTRSKRSPFKNSGGGRVRKSRKADRKRAMEITLRDKKGKLEEEKRKRVINKLKKEDGGGTGTGTGTDMHVISSSENRGRDEKERWGERPKPVSDAIESDDVNINCYSAFEYDGRRYQLEDCVMVTPEEENTRPGVAIIKGISKALDGSMSVTVQWFYRPEQLGSEEEGSWVPFDDRELLISNHQDEVPAQSIMHQCVVHFLPDWEKLPDRKKHPGHIVLDFYDHLKQKVHNITDRKYDNLLHNEIHQRILETQSRIGFEDTFTHNNEEAPMQDD
ncbi:unnamed protein product [Rhodiola kirilowii]